MEEYVQVFFFASVVAFVVNIIIIYYGWFALAHTSHSCLPRDT